MALRPVESCEAEARAVARRPVWRRCAAVVAVCRGTDLFTATCHSLVACQAAVAQRACEGSRAGLTGATAPLVAACARAAGERVPSRDRGVGGTATVVFDCTRATAVGIAGVP